LIILGFEIFAMLMSCVANNTLPRRCLFLTFAWFWFQNIVMCGEINYSVM